MENNAYEPKPKTWSEMAEIVKNRKQSEMGFGNWRIDARGDIVHKKPDYWIRKEDFKDDDWVLHMSRKGWVDLNEFFRVFSEACKRAKVNSMQRVKY